MKTVNVCLCECVCVSVNMHVYVLCVCACVVCEGVCVGASVQENKFKNLKGED